MSKVLYHSNIIFQHQYILGYSFVLGFFLKKKNIGKLLMDKIKKNKKEIEKRQNMSLTKQSSS